MAEITIYCDAEQCEYNEDGLCLMDKLHLDGNGACADWHVPLPHEPEREVQDDDKR